VRTEHGELTGYAYTTPFDTVHHFAFVHGSVGDGRGVLTRLHRANVIADTLGGGRTLQASLARFRATGRGVLVYLRDGTAGVPVQKIDEHGETSESAREQQWREVGLGAQILRDLGVSSIVNLSSKSRNYIGLAGFGIEIDSTEAVEG
jgi:3,4-dihydroxy 2-butanone 4-phosphate synthase/GTP cyclohydrolase II